MVIILVGGQWGDEGKGKVIDFLAAKADMVIRSQGGNNAGHTVITEDGEFKFQLIPSGILYPGCTCIIGNGVVVDPIVLLRELSQLQERGIQPKNLIVSERAHMVMRYHPLFDRSRRTPAATTASAPPGVASAPPTPTRSAASASASATCRRKASCARSSPSSSAR